MNTRGLLLIGVAMAFALMAAIVVRQWTNAQRVQVLAAAAPAPSFKSRVLVARGDIAAGQFLREDSGRWAAWPADDLSPEFIVEGKGAPADMKGAVARTRIVAGEPITAARVVKPGDRGFLAAVLNPGLRAVAVAVTPTTGIAGLALPGDHVDLILTHSVQLDPQTAIQASETVLEDLRVIAIDQKLDQKDDKLDMTKNVTLEVSPKQAEIASLAGEMGRLSLSLHGIGQDPPAPARLVKRTMDKEISSIVRPERQLAANGVAKPEIVVLRGTSAKGP